MYFIRRNPDIKSIRSFMRLYNVGRKSHYDILNIKRNCSDKEIKEAYIKMSKEYHPDKNKDAKAQERFVQIVEAYNVLSKPGSRAQYDAMTDATSNSSYVYRAHVQYPQYKKTNYGFYDHSKAKNVDSDSYYGIKGVKRLPNHAIILICFIVAAVGCILQLIIIRESYSIHRRKNQEKSMMLAEELEKVRETARGKPNEMQTRMLIDKIVTSANPSVATASLGQALADEKK